MPITTSIIGLLAPFLADSGEAAMLGVGGTGPPAGEEVAGGVIGGVGMPLTDAENEGVTELSGMEEGAGSLDGAVGEVKLNGWPLGADPPPGGEEAGGCSGVGFGVVGCCGSIYTSLLST